MSCDGSDDKEEDSGLKCHGFKPGPMQKQQKNIFSCFWLVACYRPPKSIFSIAANKCDNKQSLKRRKRYPLSLRCVQLPVTTQETGD